MKQRCRNTRKKGGGRKDRKRETEKAPKVPSNVGTCTVVDGKCFHGAPLEPGASFSSSWWDFYYNDLYESLEGKEYVPDVAVERAFQNDPSLIGNPDVIAFGLYGAAEALLDAWDNKELGQVDDLGWLLAESNLKTVEHVERGSFTIQKDGAPLEAGPLREKLTAETAMGYFTQYSNQDLIAALDAKIPCNCLVQLKKHVLQQPELRVCEKCKKQTEDTKVCPKCEVAEYCSRECQVADWAWHFDWCRAARGKISPAELYRQRMKRFPEVTKAKQRAQSPDNVKDSRNEEGKDRK